MEPFEWLVLGVGLAIGSLFGAKGKDLVKTAAKGYLTLEEKTRRLSAGVREDMRDAVEEARYERAEDERLREEAQLVAAAEIEAEARLLQTESVQPPKRTRRTRSAEPDTPPTPAKKRGPRKRTASAGTEAAAQGEVA